VREEISIECSVLCIPGRVILQSVRKMQKTHAIHRDKPHNIVFLVDVDVRTREPLGWVVV
jgi:hypothetical protein